jgi:tetratricopeptide (TPR) repeat protein
MVMYPSFRYWGFLSYSHDDRRAAERLHRALEAYRIPSRLVGLDGPFGPVPARLLPIFRDRDELKAGGRLGPEVERALSVSRSLIALCSPAAAASSWVDAEILAFERLHPEGPLLCVIVAGEPFACASTAEDDAECLPAALRRRFDDAPGPRESTPIAVDLRRDGDGWLLAIHKIVAGLTGLPLDQLVQRDAQRRHLRLAWLSAALGGTAITMGLLATFANRARDEAHDQRAQAEGLIEFMLSDLRKRLEPVGSLDALDAVGAQALEYYDRQPPKALDPDSLGRRARALHLIGEINDRRGDIKDARVAFANARVATAELLMRAPEDPQRLWDHAQSVYWSGYIDWQYGDTASAERAFAEYGRLARKLSAIDPSKPEWLAEVGYAHSNLGVLLLEQGRAAQAIPQFQQSLRINRKRATLPGDAASVQLDIGQDRSWLSSAHYANRQLRQAIAEREAELSIYSQLLEAAPNNAQIKERRMIALRFLGEMHLAAGDLAQAGKELGQSIVLAQELRNFDSDNVAWQESLAKSHVLAARQARRSGLLQVAQEQLDEAGRLLAAQLARDAEAWVWRVAVQESIALEQAAIYLQKNQRSMAERVLQASQHRLQETSSDAPTVRYRVANAAMQAELAAQHRDAPAAQQRWRSVVALTGDRLDRLDGDSAMSLVSAWRALGNVSDADRLDAQLRADGYQNVLYATQDGANSLANFKQPKEEN